MKNRTLTLEHLLYIVILLTAFMLRLIALGDSPLTDFEADHAFRAWQVAQGQATDLGTQPGYVLLTGLIFFVMGSSEVTARLWPVLAGSALALIPFFLRERVGRKAAVVVALGLALDPGLVALSQLAGGPVMGVSFTLFALLSWWGGIPVAAGIFGGLALLSGPTVIAGALGLAIVLAIGRMLNLFAEETMMEADSDPAETGMNPVRTGLLSAGGTLLLAGTLFLRYPQGLAALAGALPAYLEGWAFPSGVGISRVLLVFFTYPLPAVIFGSIALGRAWLSNEEQARVGRGLSLWLGVALLLAVVYPGRQAADLVWGLLPLWGLAGLELGRYLYSDRSDQVAWGLAALVMVMLMSVWTNLGGLAVSGASGQDLVLRLLVIAGALVLIGLSTALVGLGWSGEAAGRGLVWGTSMALGVAMLAGVWGASQRVFTVQVNIWGPAPGAGQQTLLLNTLGDLSDWVAGRPDSLKIVSLVDVPSLRWALRAQPNVEFREGINRDDLPEAIISLQDQEGLRLGSAYRGQDFAWWVHPSWDAWSMREWLNWLVFREGAGVSENIIVWGRGDLFPSGEAGGISLDDPAGEINLSGDGEAYIPEEVILDREDPLK